MSDLKAVVERIDVLETRLAYQDETIETLNQTITAQWKQIDVLTRQVASLRDRLEETRHAGDPARPTSARRTTEVRRVSRASSARSPALRQGGGSPRRRAG